MSAENMDLTTVSGVPLNDALDSNKKWVLTQWTHFWGFSLSHNFIQKISENSRADSQKPNEWDIWRECYSFSETENRAFVIATREAESLIQKINAFGTWKCSLSTETDALGNLYLKVQGEKESRWEGFETHMVGSHLDSVENGGKYDGVAGVAAGLEILQQVLFHQSQGTLQNSFCLTLFRSEESSPNNGVACLGSSIATGTIDVEKLEKIAYKKQNGRDVYLKEHLESSLIKYFQARARNKRWDKWEMLWWEWDEYIDHEWWYWFCQKLNITEQNYRTWDWWNKILELQKNPRITNKNTQSYHELHIEQGTLIASWVNIQLWIISGGIGGAKRYKTMERIPVESQEVSAKDYEVYSFDVFWKSDHTGSTPNNLILESSKYRRDAHIATNLFLRLFLEKDFGEFIASEAQNDEGYTKIPFHQRVTLAIRKDKKEAFTQFLRQQWTLLREENRVVIHKGKYFSSKSDIKVIQSLWAKQMISSLLRVSEIASVEFEKQKAENPEEKEFGTTRATLTNVKLIPEGLNFQLDVREVDSDDVKELMKWVSQALQSILPEGIVWLEKVSEKSHQKVDTALRDTAHEIAKILGYKTIFLPSIPGHDADRLAAVGIPVSMIFVKQQDGVSYSPTEKMTREDYNKASEVFMKTVLAKLV
jgi:hypothetical protein